MLFTVRGNAIPLSTRRYSASNLPRVLSGAAELGSSLFASSQSSNDLIAGRRLVVAPAQRPPRQPGGNPLVDFFEGLWGRALVTGAANASSVSRGEPLPSWVTMPVTLIQLRLSCPKSLLGSPAASPVRGGKFGFSDDGGKFARDARDAR